MQKSVTRESSSFTGMSVLKVLLMNICNEGKEKKKILYFTCRRGGGRKPF